MNGQLAFVILTLFLSFLLAIGIAIFSWKHRHAGVWAYPFTFVSLAAGWWAIFYVCELLAPTLDGKILWAKAQYIAIVIIPVLWFLFAMAYTERPYWLSRNRIIALLVIPLITLLLVWTNETHHLIWVKMPLLDTEPFKTLKPIYGVWFWIHFCYAYLLLFLGTLGLLQAAYHAPKTYRWQNIALVIGALIPWVANAAYLFGFSFFPYVDLSPVAFVLSGVVLAWSIFRFHLFDMVPIARRVAVETMSDGVIVLDDKNHVIDMNPAALMVFETELSTVLNQSISDLLANWPELLNSFKDVWEAETEIRLQDHGIDRYFKLHISPLLNTRQQVNGRLVVFHDITVYKNAEAALAEARDQALEASRIKTELLARVSHELRTPLNVILGFSEMMQLGITGPVNKKQYDTLEKILESTHFLTDQVNDLLNLSSIEAGTIRLHYHTFPITDVINEVINRWQEDATNKSLQLIKTDAAKPIDMVYGDRDGINQVLSNLVGNAIKFSTTGTIEITAFAHDDDFWALKVSDEGPGIPPEAHNLIFEPFRQIDGSMTRIHGGTGLGLTIVKQMTELMGGTVELQSAVGQGSQFTVLFPHEFDVPSIQKL